MSVRSLPFVIVGAREKCGALDYRAVGAFAEEERETAWSIKRLVFVEEERETIFLTTCRISHPRNGITLDSCWRRGVVCPWVLRSVCV